MSASVTPSSGKRVIPQSAVKLHVACHRSCLSYRAWLTFAIGYEASPMRSRASYSLESEHFAALGRRVKPGLKADCG